MAAIDDLNTAVANQGAEVTALGVIITAAVATIQAGVPTTNDPAIEAAATAVTSATAQLVAAGKALLAVLPATPAPPAPPAP